MAVLFVRYLFLKNEFEKKQKRFDPAEIRTNHGER